eukprot:11877660-Alexandrium_andersonii.AAC.1
MRNLPCFPTLCGGAGNRLKRPNKDAEQLPNALLSECCCPCGRARAAAASAMATGPLDLLRPRSLGSVGPAP